MACPIVNSCFPGDFLGPQAPKLSSKLPAAQARSMDPPPPPLSAATVLGFGINGITSYKVRTVIHYTPSAQRLERLERHRLYNRLAAACFKS